MSGRETLQTDHLWPYTKGEAALSMLQAPDASSGGVANLKLV